MYFCGFVEVLDYYGKFFELVGFEVIGLHKRSCSVMGLIEI